MPDLKYWISFNRLPEMGALKFQKLLKNFPTMEEAWRANLPELMSAGLTEKEANNIIINRSAINPGEELEKLIKLGIRAITITDADYPKNLKEIFDAPPILFYRGSIACLSRHCLAVVGARKHTAYGEAAAKKIVTPLAKNNITIVSGLALGIDALAHEATFKAGGLTAAVLGSDLDWKNIGPKTNLKLAEQILDSNGCLISEYSLGTTANRQTFPQRNRIISGLSRGVLIVEAGENSGSLITAACAVEQNRDVFAVPDSIFSPYSTGANNLIKRGAKPVTEADDILGDWLCQGELKLNKKELLETADEIEKIILDKLSFEPLHLDKLTELCQIKINMLSSKLMIMEMKGLVRSIDGGKYMKSF
jgi:DNA processing protein